MNAATAGTKAAQVAADLVTLDQKILAMGQDPTAPVAWPTITSLTYGTPSVNLTFDTLLALGGQNNQSGGNPYDDRHDGFVPGLDDADWRIASLMVQGGSWVDFIQVGYQDANGHEVILQHGGGGASTVVNPHLMRSAPSQTLHLQAGEFIISARGLYGHYCNQLTFTTSRDQTLTWPPNPQQCPDSAAWNNQTPQRVFAAGFQGRANKYLDQLELVCVSFSPATWS